MRVLLVLFLSGCTITAEEYGKELFSDPGVSTAGSNPFSCATCHETTPTQKKLLPGYTLHNTTVRPSWWGGFELTLLSSINQCVTQFMRGRELSADEEKARALNIYLRSLSPDATAEALPLTIVKDIRDVPSGDPAQGKRIYDESCGNCHGAPHTGDGRISAVASIIPDDTLESFGTDPFKGARPITIEKIRHGKFFAVGGNMPMFSLEVLTDEQVGQVLGYLETFGLPK